MTVIQPDGDVVMRRTLLRGDFELEWSGQIVQVVLLCTRTTPSLAPGQLWVSLATTTSST